MARSKYVHADGIFNQPVRLVSATAFLLAVTWIAFVGTVHLHESIVGAVVVVLSSAFAALVYRYERFPFALRWRDVRQCWRIPWYILSGCWEITFLLGKDLAGQRAESLVRVCGFRTGLRDPVLVQRTALAIAYTTTAPNFIVIGIDRHQNHMIFHQIARSGIPKMTQALGAQA